MATRAAFEIRASQPSPKGFRAQVQLVAESEAPPQEDGELASVLELELGRATGRQTGLQTGRARHRVEAALPVWAVVEALLQVLHPGADTDPILGKELARTKVQDQEADAELGP